MSTIEANLRKLKLRGLLSALKGARRLSVSFQLRKGLLFLGDFLLLNVALFLALTVRHFEPPMYDSLTRHLIAFNIVHGSWLLIFYSFGLYDIERFNIPGYLGKRLVQGLSVAGVLTILLFYVLSFPELQPKTILVLDLIFAATLLLAGRSFFRHWGQNGFKTKVLLCGRETEISQIQELLDHNEHFGYKISRPLVFRDDENVSMDSRILDRLQQDHNDILAITRSLSEDLAMRGLFYRLLCTGIHVINVSNLSEELTKKVPISVINEGWFIENLSEFNKRGFEIFKRCLDISASVLLGLPSLLFLPLLALAIKLDSRGSIFFRQQRVGKGGLVFEFVKFRTMVSDAETMGAQWADEGDSRITRVGKLLRKTRVDELPQLWNVLKGEMSLVGPRPERPEFVKKLTDIVPFYETRHLVKPGLTGWAQINFRYGSSVGDTVEKLKYDLYYVKNRSMLLELSILLKTVSTVIRSEGR